MQWSFKPLLLSVVALALLLLTADPANVAAQDDEATPQPIVQQFDETRIQQATVFVMQAQANGSDLNITCFGSGTIVSRDGLVLTNAHHTLPSESCQGDVLIIALSVDAGAPPVPRFRADVVQANQGLDLALLRITRSYDGRLLDPQALALPYVEIGDSAAARLDETITVVGYPGIGNDAVTRQAATIVSFLDEPGAGESAWMKTSAAFPASITGGGAYNLQGQLIGIPTTAPVNPTLPGSSCINLQDTNFDSRIDARDRCVPVGGQINTIRPSDFARPLLVAAQLSVTVSGLGGSPASSAAQAVQQTPEFRRLFFSPAVNEAGLPTQVVRSLPAGSTSLYLFFDYANMSPETVFEVRVTTNGVNNSTLSLSPVRWGGGPNGLWYIGSRGQPIPNGDYEFTLLADGIAAETARLTVGSSANTDAQFSDPVFGISDDAGNISGNGFILPIGNIASAVFIYRQMPPDVPWAQLWYYEGVEIARTEQTWTDGPSGAKTISVQDSGGLLPGVYRLELYIDGSLSATADFTIAGAPQGALPQAFSNLRFVSAESAQDAAVSPPVSTFSSGQTSIFALFDWQSIAVGTPWSVRWLIDDTEFYRQSGLWVQSFSGDTYLISISSPGGLSDGTYTLELYLGGLRLARADGRVGIGQRPLDPLSQTDGIRLQGRILDAGTEQGIPGVSFIVINEQFSVADFLATYDTSMVTALAITDREGRFVVDRPLSFELPYSVVIIAEGYLPVQADGVTIAPEDVPLDLTIYLSRG